MKYQLLTTEEEVRALIEWHNAGSEYVVIDLETTGLSPFEDHILHVVLTGYDPHSAVMFSGSLCRLLDLLHVGTLVLHNFKFDFNFLFRAGVDLRGRSVVRDTMLLHHLLDENKPHGLDAIVQERWQDPYKEVFWSRNKSYEAAPQDEQLEYACKDVVYTGMLYEHLTSALKEDEVPRYLVEHVHRLALALYETEITGIAIDVDYLQDIATKLKLKIHDLREQMRAAAPVAIEAVEFDLWAKQIDEAWTPKGKKWKTLPKPEFSFDSNKQLTELLYEKLELPAQKNKAKNYTADDEALTKIKDKHPIVPLVQEYRGHNKVYGAFIEGTLERMRDGRIFPSFNVNGTVTGRISSSNPNMQQLPRDGGIRGIYIPDLGRVFISCDYAQLEVVIAAHFSQDKNLLKILNDGASMHDITAESLKIERHLAKTINFAMQYQCSHFKIAEILGCHPAEAQRLWNKYWQTYAGVKRIVDECAAKVDRGEPIVNPFGRKRRFPTRFESKGEEASAKRQAFSSLIQGTGADCTHEAFYNVADRLWWRDLGRAVFEVHDEIVIEVRKECVDEATEILTSEMIKVGERIGLTVPLKVDCSDPLERWSK